MAYVGVSLPNLPALLKKLEVDAILGKEWSEGLRAIVRATEQRAEGRAPGGSSGSIAPAISSKMDPRPVPLFGTVDVAPLNNKGFRYPWALDAAKSFRRNGKETTYHYRGTDKPTRGWFRGARSTALVQRFLAELAGKIEAKWRT